jgi:hypothetical protein
MVTTSKSDRKTNQRWLEFLIALVKHRIELLFTFGAFITCVQLLYTVGWNNSCAELHIFFGWFCGDGTGRLVNKILNMPGKHRQIAYRKIKRKWKKIGDASVFVETEAIPESDTKIEWAKYIIISSCWITWIQSIAALSSMFGSGMNNFTNQLTFNKQVIKRSS